MKVIQISRKSKSPKIDFSNINKILNKKGNNSKNSKVGKTRNNDFLSNKIKSNNFYKKIFPTNNYLHFSSNNCTSSNTTNYNNSKTNNFIILEHGINLKDTENLKQHIKSLIKHHSSNNFPNLKSNVKSKDNNFKGEKEIKKKKKDYAKNVLKNRIKKNSYIDILNKNEKIHINTNNSVLLNHLKKENDIKLLPKVKNYRNFFNIYNSRPLTLNFANDFNNFNSYKMLLNNKSMKNLNKKNKSKYKKKLVLKKNTSKTKKVKSEEKDSKKKYKLIDKKIIKESNSFNLLYNRKKFKLSDSVSFSPVFKKNTKKKLNKRKNAYNLPKINNNISSMATNNSNEKMEINLYSKKYNNSKKKEGENKSSVITSENQLDIKLLSRIYNRDKANKNTYKKNCVITSQKTSPFCYKKLNTKNKNKTKSNTHLNIFIDKDIYHKSMNNTFKKSNNKKQKNISIRSPEQAHFLAIKQMHQIRKNNVFG